MTETDVVTLRAARADRAGDHEPPEVPQRAELGDDLRPGRRVLPGGRRRRRQGGHPRRRRRPLLRRPRHRHARAGTSTSPSTGGPDCGGTTSTSTGVESRYARELEVYLGMCRRWREIPKPTIAMVQGACIAGGLMLAWGCDLIVAADDAFFADPVVRMGIPGVEYFAHPWVMGPRVRQGVPVHRRAGRRGARPGAGDGQPGGAPDRLGPRPSQSLSRSPRCRGSAWR